MNYEGLIEIVESTVQEFNTAVLRYIDVMNSLPEDADDEVVDKVNYLTRNLPPTGDLQNFLDKWYKDK